MGERDQARRQIDPVWLDGEIARGGPAGDAVGEVAVGAADVEERAGAIDGVGDRAASAIQRASGPLKPDCCQGVSAPA